MTQEGNKKFLLTFGGVALFTLLLFLVQIKKNISLTTSRVDTPLVSLETTDIPLDQSDATLGNPGATITLVGYLDFGNRQDRLMYQTIANSVKDHPLDIRFVLKHAPYSNFVFESTHNKIHESIICASNQKKLWPYVDELAKISTLWRNKQLTDAAAAANLNTQLFSSCLESPNTPRTLAELALSSKQLAPEPPTLFANNKQVHLTKDVSLEQLLQSFITP